MCCNSHVLDSEHKSGKWTSLLNKSVNHVCLFLEFLSIFFFAKWLILVTHVVWIKFNFMQFNSIYSICHDSQTPETGKTSGRNLEQGQTQVRELLALLLEM